MDMTTKMLLTIKIGSNILTDSRNQLDLNVLRHLIQQIAFLKQKGLMIVVVTSGAIVCGSAALGINPESLEDKQASAAVGQVILMEHYQLFFEKLGFKVGQVLLTKDGLLDQTRAKLAKNTFNRLLELDVIPIVNENDTVSVDEIKFSDNDTLSSMVSILLGADLQIFLTDIDGVYNADPRTDKEAKLISRFRDIPETLRSQMSAESVSQKGRGGMKSKVTSAQLLLENNIESIIAPGKRENVLLDLYRGQIIGTFCLKGDLL